MRNMSFSMTTHQFIAGTKDVTRRFGWWFLKPGDRVRAVEKAMGLKKGEKIKVLGVIEIVSVRAEPLDDMKLDDCRREGFPAWYPAQFIEMICKHYRKKPSDIINRIEFRKLAIDGDTNG
jgi:hypothetical protein